ncbi:MAG: 50S ribosomal protein L25 [Patescibacteria group bacterium]|nr:50S ribosomal protein L25 [Patescibacteria group bacterium]MBU1877086.1 50S ribosomal protein L25 [Patescibacteria group bacterium]
MISLSSKIREISGKGLEKLRNEGEIPAVLYGSETKNTSLSVSSKDFQKVYQDAGENTMIELGVNDKKFVVFIHQVQHDVVTGKPIHVDFFQPSLTEEIELNIPLVFEGESEAVDTLGGTLVKHLFELEVKSLPQNIPGEIKVDITKLKTLEDEIFVKDLKIPVNVKVIREPDEIIATISSVAEVEEELEKPLEEKVEDVEKIEKKQKEKEGETNETEK